MRFALAWGFALAASACHERREPTRVAPTACEAVHGDWVGDDVDVADASESERSVAREMVRMNRWRVTADALVTLQNGEQTTESLRVVEADRAHCVVDLANRGERRALRFEPRGEDRFRVSGPGMRTAILWRRPP